MSPLEDFPFIAVLVTTQSVGFFLPKESESPLLGHRLAGVPTLPHSI